MASYIFLAKSGAVLDGFECPTLAQARSAATFLAAQHQTPVIATVHNFDVSQPRCDDCGKALEFEDGPNIFCPLCGTLEDRSLVGRSLAIVKSGEVSRAMLVGGVVWSVTDYPQRETWHVVSE